MHGRSQMSLQNGLVALHLVSQPCRVVACPQKSVAVACLLRRHLYEEALTCLAARVLRCACVGVGA
jgi:hypothetical protein